MKTKHTINLLKRKGNESEDEDNEYCAQPSEPTELSGPKVLDQGVRRSAGPMIKYLGIRRDEDTMAATIARMTACDGMPFAVFTTSLK